MISTAFLCQELLGQLSGRGATSRLDFEMAGDMAGGCAELEMTGNTRNKVTRFRMV